MVASFSSLPIPSRPAVAITLGILALMLMGIVGDGPRGDPAPEIEPGRDRASLAVWQPTEWGFWDQMASIFSAAPMPGELLGRPGAEFRWWFDETYLASGAAARSLDLMPAECGGMSDWLDEFGRYDFSDGERFVRSRLGPCPTT